jgi:hypothetical protein
MSFKSSESIKNLSKALLKAQTQMGSAKKDSKNPFFKSTYADLPTVMEVVKTPLNESGIIVLQPSSHRDGKNFITTTLIHSDTGEWMESETEVVSAKANDPQAFGAAQTYARRFGLQAMLFIPAEDDDGNTAAGRTPSAQTAKPSYYTTTVVNAVNVNAEFDAIPNPTPVAQAPTPAPVQATASKSTFRKTKPVATTTAPAPTAVAQSSDEWS